MARHQTLTQSVRMSTTALDAAAVGRQPLVPWLLNLSRRCAGLCRRFVEARTGPRTIADASEIGMMDGQAGLVGVRKRIRPKHPAGALEREEGNLIAAGRRGAFPIEPAQIGRLHNTCSAFASDRRPRIAAEQSGEKDDRICGPTLTALSKSPTAAESGVSRSVQHKRIV